MYEPQIVIGKKGDGSAASIRIDASTSIDDMLSEIGDLYDEGGWCVLGYENCEGIREHPLSEDLRHVAEYMAFLEEHSFSLDIAMTVLARESGNILHANEIIEAHVGSFFSWKELGEEFLRNDEYLITFSENFDKLMPYIDCAAYGRDATKDYDVLELGKYIHVFAK